ncbi:MAG: 4Fe-4S binding protein [Firmicutes bacterium]|nr:4Fe-4S binding protein [Bacillota bacterium]
MNKHVFTQRILKGVAQAIRKGEKPFDKKRLAGEITDDCFTDTKERDIWRPIVAQRIDMLLSEEGALFTHMRDVCRACDDGRQRCSHVCPTDALVHSDEGITINWDRCIECGLCVDACILGAIVARSDFARVAYLLMRSDEQPVYAILAPAFVGQFGLDVTPTKLKGALLQLGFHGVYEVAMTADIITTQEAEELVERFHKGEQFMITSCCCPAFMRLVEKTKPKLVELVSHSVSPMIALGRLLKAKEDCTVVFIGPCVAKKAEAQRPDLKGAIDSVLTFREAAALFEAAKVDLASIGEETTMEDASHDGRIYARTEGVTAAITRAVNRIDPSLNIEAVHGDGIRECMTLLKLVEQGKLAANFMEGMACAGGCVGGPGTIISAKEGREHVNEFAQTSTALAAPDNDKAEKWLLEYGPEVDFTTGRKAGTASVEELRRQDTR